MEVLRGCRAVDDPDVSLGGEVEEASHPCARMLRTLSLVAMREQQCQAGGQSPLCQTGGDELIDDDLSGIDEVPELRFPQNQCLRCRDAVPVLEAERRQLRQRAIVELHGGQGTGKISDWRQRLPGIHVVEDEMTLAEGAALGVLAGEADRHTLSQERAESKSFGVRPLDATIGTECRPAPLQLLSELRVHRKSLGPAVQLV